MARAAIPDRARYIARIAQIIGQEFGPDQTAALSLNWNDGRDGDLLIARLSLMQAKLRNLRVELADELDVFHNLLGRSKLSADQSVALAEAISVKYRIDETVASFESAKSSIQASPSYQIREARFFPPKPLTRFYIYHNEQVIGPYILDQLFALKDDRTINWDTQCCVEGTEDWLPFADALGE